jgi:serine/threonine protein kinase
MSELERYRIDEEIGRGAMGVVYRAWDLTLEREVALKELTFPAGMATSVRQEMVERFFREARSAARLTHPNVVQVFDVLSEGDRYFIAMELLSGAPLGALLERGPLPASAAVQIMVQILDGVQAAHSAGIVHRDLKPDNIHILDDGRVKVTDFGIAKIMSGLGTGTMTQMGTIIGTPGYMAPEQVRGEAVDHRTDVFALGVVFYEMLAGSNPFLADAPTTILYRIVHE